MIGKIISLVFGAIVVGALAPGAVTALATPVNVTGWTPATIAIYGVLGFGFVIGVALLILKEAGVEF